MRRDSGVLKCGHTAIRPSVLDSVSIPIMYHCGRGRIRYCSNCKPGQGTSFAVRGMRCDVRKNTGRVNYLSPGLRRGVAERSLGAVEMLAREALDATLSCFCDFFNNHFRNGYEEIIVSVVTFVPCLLQWLHPRPRSRLLPIRKPIHRVRRKNPRLCV